MVKEGNWESRTNYPVGDLEGNVLGIIGYGRIGKKVSELALAFGMQVKAFDPIADIPKELNSDLEEIFSLSDYLTLHIPLTPENQNLINSKTIANMKAGAIIINCSRGALLS